MSAWKRIMALAHSADLLDAIRALPLLEAAQLETLSRLHGSFPDARSLAQKLVHLSRH
jgi:hypothetical protein